MATARKAQSEDCPSQDNKAVKVSHPLYLYVRRVRENIAKHSFQGLETHLHEIAAKCKEDGFRVDPRSKMAKTINSLFTQAKETFQDDDDFHAAIRCKQAMYLENMGHAESALAIYTSVAKTECGRRWYAMNCRTWLLRSSGNIEAAKKSAEELLTAYDELPLEKKPSNNAFTTAKKMYDEMTADDVSETKLESSTARVSTSHFTKFRRAPHPRKKAATPTAEVTKSATASSLFQ